MTYHRLLSAHLINTHHLLPSLRRSRPGPRRQQVPACEQVVPCGVQAPASLVVPHHAGVRIRLAAGRRGRQCRGVLVVIVVCVFLVFGLLLILVVFLLVVVCPGEHFVGYAAELRCGDLVVLLSLPQAVPPLAPGLDHGLALCEVQPQRQE